MKVFGSKFLKIRHIWRVAWAQHHEDLPWGDLSASYLLTCSLIIPVKSMPLSAQFDFSCLRKKEAFFYVSGTLFAIEQELPKLPRDVKLTAHHSACDVRSGWQKGLAPFFPSWLDNLQPARRLQFYKFQIVTGHAAIIFAFLGQIMDSNKNTG